MIRRLRSPLRVTRPPPSMTTRRLRLTTFAVACIRIVTGAGPHENRITPPWRTAATTRSEVQLAGVPWPTTRSARAGPAPANASRPTNTPSRSTRRSTPHRMHDDRAACGQAGPLKGGQFVVVAPDLLQRVDDLAFGDAGARRIEQQRHQVGVGGGGAADRVQRGVDDGRVSAFADGFDAVDLLLLERGINPQDRQLALVALGEAVDADDRAAARIDLLLELEGGVGDLALRKAALDGLDHPPELVDLVKVLVGARLHPVGQRLDEIRAPKRIDRVRHARLLGDDLLRAQRDPDRLLSR